MDKITKRTLTFVLIIFINVNLFGQTEGDNFSQIYSLIQQRNFFKAKDVYNSNKESLSFSHQYFTEVCIDNAFNKLNESNGKIQMLIENYQKELSDSLKLHIYKLKADNSLKLYEYKKAKNAIEFILKEYTKLLDEETANDYKNSLKIWTALENQPKQKVVARGENKLKLIKDKADLKNLRVSNAKDTLNFIFDTGANLSTTSKSVAERFKMTIIPTDIEVGSITGIKVSAQLAICDKLTLGNIDVYNIVFLVLEDKGLYFPQIDYQIYGILGFPLIEALKEVQITKDGYFIVPKKETRLEASSNMAMDGLTPLIQIEDKHFTFDTGATNTILYSNFYTANRKEIDSNYTETTVKFGGAGGNKDFEGYKIDYSFNLLGKRVNLNDISLLKSDVSINKKVYGNIGQDVIKQFDKMTLNFNQMFIKFD
ncbi:aspartyl protease family protein [Mesonia hippocampi]|uniref:aspartyl protease family protein n=1 Tax=Mesonia hippocampi TaxID=1628250 RepID=UPI003F9D181A